MGSKFRVEIVIFGIADPDLPIHYATFKGSLLLSAPIVKHFQGKKTKSSVFSAKIWQFWGINIYIKFKFYNPEKAHPCVISRLLSYRA